jgi:hypothetical protein
MAIAEVKTTYRAVYWLKGAEKTKCEVYLVRNGNNKFVERDGHHPVLCADINLAIRKGKVTGGIKTPTMGDEIIYKWYLYNVETVAEF